MNHFSLIFNFHVQLNCLVYSARFSKNIKGGLSLKLYLRGIKTGFPRVKGHACVQMRVCACMYRSLRLNH